jgi:hypothetical protein
MARDRQPGREWTEVGNIAQQLLDRRIAGKAVLHVSG